jgi:hypothetical protein
MKTFNKRVIFLLQKPWLLEVFAVSLTVFPN